MQWLAQTGRNGRGWAALDVVFVNGRLCPHIARRPATTAEERAARPNVAQTGSAAQAAWIHTSSRTAAEVKPHDYGQFSDRIDGNVAHDAFEVMAGRLAAENDVSRVHAPLCPRLPWQPVRRVRYYFQDWTWRLAWLAGNGTGSIGFGFKSSNSWYCRKGNITSFPCSESHHSSVSHMNIPRYTRRATG